MVVMDLVSVSRGLRPGTWFTPGGRGFTARGTPGRIWPAPVVYSRAVA